jgi:vacuolar-type H+-ATPase subunit F/Vma7
VRIAVVGSPEDVRGFALLGLTGQVAEGSRDVEAALEAAAREGLETGLLLVSACAARLAPEAILGLQRREGAPVVLVLPEELSR